MKVVIQKWWFWLMVVFVITGLSSTCSDNNKEAVVCSDQFSIQIGSNHMKVNDLELSLDAPVREIDWHSYVPLRFFLDWFEAEEVTYDRATEVITFKLPRYKELDPAIIAKYDAQKKIAKPVEPPKKVETPPVVKEPAKKDETPSNEEIKLMVLNIMKNNYANIATCSINEELKAFTVTPLDKGFAEAAVYAKQGNVELKKVWDTSLNDYKTLSREIHKMLPGYSLVVCNPASPDRMLIAVTNGVVLIDAVNNP